MRKFSEKQMIAVAKQEMDEWVNVPQGLLMAIYFAFIHRLTTGNTIEETFRTWQQTDPDYEI